MTEHPGATWVYGELSEWLYLLYRAEKQAEEFLSKFIRHLDAYPQVKQRVKTYLIDVKGHSSLVLSCIERMGGKKLPEYQREGLIVRQRAKNAPAAVNVYREGEILMSRRLSIVVGVITMCLTSSPTMGYDEAHLNQLLKTKNCKGCDLSRIGVYQIDLDDADLSGANLTDAVVTWSFMRRANLLGAKIAGLSLIYTNLVGATWTDGTKCGEKSIGECVPD